MLKKQGWQWVNVKIRFRPDQAGFVIWTDHGQNFSVHLGLFLSCPSCNLGLLAGKCCDSSEVVSVARDSMCSVSE